MEVLETIKARAQKIQARVVFTEWQDERILKATCILANEHTAKPILVGPEAQIQSKLRSLGYQVDADIAIVDPQTFSESKQLAFDYYMQRRSKGMGFFEAKTALQDPTLFGSLLVHTGKAEGMVCGATLSTAAVLRAALKTIGVKPGVTKISSTMLMVSSDTGFGDNGILFFADCAVIPDPNPEELADIALSTASTAKKLLDMEPRIAFLSFSSKGSAKHELVNKVTAAHHIAKTKAPTYVMDGELQLDAAIIPSVAQAKAPGSPVKGNANILIFPDLNAGNIGYKLAQRFGHLQAIGPIIQGLRRPVNDLSRGCSVEDIVNVAAIIALLSQ